MSAVVKALYEPDLNAMRAHVEHLFGGDLGTCADGKIELAWTDNRPDTAGRYRLKNARLYGVNEISELVDYAAMLNSTNNCNVYIGAALRKPDAAPFGRAQDSDAYALTCAYVDLDDPGAAGQAKDIYGLDKPTFIVLTGRAPHVRAQMWWKLDEPIQNTEWWPSLLRGIAHKMGGDGTVTNPSRVMRLAGSIAWPVKPGRTIELTSIAPLREPGPPSYAVEHLAGLFPAIAEGSTSAVPAPVTHTTNSLGLADRIADGRESYMRDTIAACLVEYIGTNGAAPSAQELYDIAWPQYERKVDLTRAGRGPEEFAEKCAYTIKRFERGEIHGAETLEAAVASYAKKERARAEAGIAPPKLDPSTGEPLPLLLSAAQFISGFRPPEYLIDGILQQSYLYSLTARTGHGKTAVDMYMGQAVARGLPFHGKPTKQGSVLFLAGENPDDVRARFLVLADHEGFDPSTIPFYFVDGVIDIAASLPRIRAEAANIPNLALTIVDTAAAYFRGDDGNNNSQQGEYARLLRQLTFLPGKPACLVNCHPVKNASKDNLLPVGGGAFLNEVDGNLTLWSNAEKQATLHWQGKFRGPEFEPMAFEMKTVESEKVVDANGALMPSVVAAPISELILEHGERSQEDDENLVLKIIAASPRASMNQIATTAKFVSENGRPQKSKVQRIITRLLDDKLVEKHRGNKYRPTKKGKREIGMEDCDD